MAADKGIRSTIMYAFAATTPAPPRPEPPQGDEGPEIVVDLDDRGSLTPIGDGPNDVSRTFASIPPPPSALLPEVGDVVGSLYRLVRPLGEGTFGRVYVAQRLDVPEHQVALKIMPRSLYVGRNVERELVMLATVGHPHVVQLKDHGTTDEYVWLTMPVYEGETLHERLQRGPLSLREAYDIFRAMAYGLEALHDAGLRHQDIKPENIFLAVFGRRIHPVLLDLGVAAEREAAFIAGTALYASPEQIFALDANIHRAPLSEKMDTYCLATTLLMSLVGPAHFPGETATQPAELAVAHATRAGTPIAKEALPELTGAPREKLIATLKTWLALEPKDRPSMTEVAEQLEVLLEKEREEKRNEQQAKERQKTALLRVRVAVGALLIGALASAVIVFAKRETLQMASELEKARSEGGAAFDKLDTCVASHKLARGEAAACKAARDKDQAEFQSSLETLSQKGSSGDADKVRNMQTMVASYTGKLRACEEGASAAQKTCVEDQNRLVAISEKEKGELEKARDEQKALAEARDKELTSTKSERETCAAERATCNNERATCIDQKAQILIACAGVPTKPASTAGGTTPATTTVPAGSTVPATTAAPAGTTPAPTATVPSAPTATAPPSTPPPPPLPAPRPQTAPGVTTPAVSAPPRPPAPAPT